MEAVVVLRPMTNKPIFKVGSNEIKRRWRKSLSNFGLCLKNRGSKKIEAIRNLINEKLKGGICLIAILITVDAAPPNMDANKIARIAFVLLDIFMYYILN